MQVSTAILKMNGQAVQTGLKEVRKKNEEPDEEYCEEEREVASGLNQSGSQELIPEEVLCQEGTRSVKSWKLLKNG